MDIASLANLGAAGIVLAWFMASTDPRLKRIERAIDRLTRAQMLTLISRSDVDVPIKKQAHAILKEMDANWSADEGQAPGGAL